MKYFARVNGRTFVVELGAEGVRVDGEGVSAELAHLEGTELHHLLLDGRSQRFLARREDGVWNLHLPGRRLEVEVLDERTRVIREMTRSSAKVSGPRPVRAPMPGLVVKVEVEEGDRVDAGQGVVIVEAMKMENELKAEAPGVVARIHVTAGDAVEKDQVLIDMAAPESAAEEEA
ncbi:MAG: acetyl-CoA carboxylase biotin carboxyl carrier protein subunit [Gemmatimonadota bacterium]